MNHRSERIKMSGKRNSTFLVLSILVVFLAGCALPYMTPPAEYSATEPPTITPPVPGTAVPATTTVQPIAREITIKNAADLKAAVIAPASNVLTIVWAKDSSTLGIITQNTDANGNWVSSAVILDGETLAMTAFYNAPEGRIAALSPDGKSSAVISADMTTMNIYDLSDGNRDAVSITPGYLINDVTFSPSGKYFTISSNESWLVSLHSMPDGAEVQTLTGFETAAPIYNAGFKGSNDAIVWHARATIQTQNVSSGKMGIATSSEDFVDYYALTPDGKLLASAAMKTIDGNNTSTVTLWNAASGSEVRILILEQAVSCMTFSADGSMLAVGSGNNILVYEVSSGSLLATLSGHSGLPMAVAFSPDGYSLASAGQDNQLILWQVMQ
jgi:WD40 repeat protein